MSNRTPPSPSMLSLLQASVPHLPIAPKDPVMILSMTGYGKADAVIDGTPTTVELRSVNGRFLEMNVRLPREWADREGAIRDLLKKSIQRGSVNVYVRREQAADQHALHVDWQAAEAYVSALQQLQQRFDLAGAVSIDNVSGYAPIFQGSKPTTDQDAVTRDVVGAVERALHELQDMRVREGAMLALDLQERLATITEHLNHVEQLTAERIPQERARLRERVAQLVGEEHIDEQRLQLEITLLADRLDITEECVRLRSHMKHVVDDLSEGGSVGRKLNFQLQEMNREVNTMGSKSNDAVIGRHVVMMKEELERMREQVQNIE